MPRTGFNADWAWGIQSQIRRLVEERFRSDLHRWPLLTSFECEVYAANDRYRLFILKDRGPASVIPSISSINDARPWPDSIVRPSQNHSIIELAASLETVTKSFNLSLRDAAIFVRQTEASGMQDEWDNHWTEEDRTFHSWQIEQAMNRHQVWIHGFDMRGTFFLPPGYEFLAPQCEAFFRDHPRFDRNVFLMTRFDSSTKAIVELDDELHRVLREIGAEPVRADDKMYMPDRNLWNNVCVYMLCSGQGIAILEDRVQDEFNPNVALEYGFMRALNRPTLLLADVGFRNLRADVIGTLRETFDLFSIKETLAPAISRWAASINLLRT